MQLVLNDIEPVTIQPGRRMTDEEFYEFCRLNPDLRIERTAQGEIIVMPPTGGETGYRNNDLTMQLGLWARRDGRGRAFDSSTQFMLPDSASRSPDASWIERSRLAALTREQKRKFLPLCPDFVVELTSPTDRLTRVQEKMREWIANGARRGWLIDADDRTVYIYRQDGSVEKLEGADRIVGEGPVEGFTLDLKEIWDPDI